MPEIRPFAAIRYRPGDPSFLAQVLAPPYDVISPAYARTLEARHESNVVRIVLNLAGDPDGYRRAGDTFRAWIERGVLAPDPEPSLYVLEQTFSVGGTRYRRRGLLARLRAEDYAAGSVLPHEHTRKAAREDRFLMLQALRANLSPIFTMVPDSAGDLRTALEDVARADAAAEYRDDTGVEHRLVRVAAEDPIARLTGLIARTSVFIADGHHRYATALRHRDVVGPEGAWTLGYFVPVEDPGLVVLPYHRVVVDGPSLADAEGRLARHSEIRVVEGLDALATAVQSSQAPHAFGLADRSGRGLLVEALPGSAGRLPAGTPPCLAALDTYFVHRHVLPDLLGVDDAKVRYVHSLDEARSSVAEADGPLALVLRATPVAHIIDVARAGESMPAKSTFFHPKLPSGLVIHPLVV